MIFPDNHLSSGAYAAEINDFSKRFEVIAFDYPTPGKSTQKVKYPDDREVDYWWFWADLACHLLVELEIDRCFELGVGGGALVGLHFSDEQASDHPIEVQGIVLDSFLAKMDTHTLHRWLDERELFYDRNKKSLREPHGENWRAVVDQDTQYLWKLADRGGYQEPEFILNTIACPVLLTGRVEDRILPNLVLEYAQISRLIPNCSIYLSSKANHATLERPFMRTDSDCFQCLTDLFSKRLLNLD